MNKAMQNVMKPIPVEKGDKADLRLAQEDHVLGYLQTTDHSVNCADVYNNCENIPGIIYNVWGSANYRNRRVISRILQRLEKKGHVVSVLYGRYRYYSVPVNYGMTV